MKTRLPNTFVLLLLILAAIAAATWLVPGGQFAMETSKRQAGATAELFTAQGLSVQVRSSAELAATLVIGAVQNAAE